MSLSTSFQLPEIYIPQEGLDSTSLYSMSQQALELYQQAAAHELLSVFQHSIREIHIATSPLNSVRIGLVYEAHEGIYWDDYQNYAGGKKAPEDVSIKPGDVREGFKVALFLHLLDADVVIIRRDARQEFLREVYGEKFDMMLAEVLKAELSKTDLPLPASGCKRLKF